MPVLGTELDMAAFGDALSVKSSGSFPEHGHRNGFEKVAGLVGGLSGEGPPRP